MRDTVKDLGSGASLALSSLGPHLAPCLSGALSLRSSEGCWLQGLSCPHCHTPVLKGPHLLGRRGTGAQQGKRHTPPQVPLGGRTGGMLLRGVSHYIRMEARWVVRGPAALSHGSVGDSEGWGHFLKMFVIRTRGCLDVPESSPGFWTCWPSLTLSSSVCDDSTTPCGPRAQRSCPTFPLDSAPRGPAVPWGVQRVPWLHVAEPRPGEPQRRPFLHCPVPMCGPSACLPVLP